MGNCFVSICTDHTVVIQTVHSESVTLTHDIVQHRRCWPPFPVDITHMREQDRVVYATLLCPMCPILLLRKHVDEVKGMESQQWIEFAHFHDGNTCLVNRYCE